MKIKMNAGVTVNRSKGAQSSAAALALVALMTASGAGAFELGHSRVTSSPGQPLVVQVPITGMSPQEVESLSVSVAPGSVWQTAGATPPVPLDSMSVSVVPGRTEGSRIVQLRSSQATQSTVVDVLLAISTSASSRTVQTSIIVPPPPKVRVAVDQVTVQRGDTLIGIAEQFPVQGANLYQQLWALYSSNPEAFLRENMNLLKAGAALRIPDADAVRAVDPVFAKAQYLEHVRAFRQGRGGSQGNEGIAASAPAQTLQAPPEQQQGAVQEASTATPPPANDQVRLTAAEQDAQTAQADAETARAKAVAEEQERKQALEQNIDALQGAIASSANGASNAQAQAGQVAGGEAAQQGSSSGSSSAGVAGQPNGDPSKQSSDTAAGQSAGTGSANADGSSGSDASNGSDAQQSAGASADGQTATDPSAASLFTRASQWISDNTTAAIALLLALIALILAWALRATKRGSTAVEAVEKRVDHAATNFEQQLKDIDLSLDDKKAEPSLSKPDEKV